MAQHSRRRSWLVISYVAVTPDPVLTVFSDQTHQAAVGGVCADPFQVVVKLGLEGGGEEFFEVPSDAFLHGVAEGAPHGWVDGQKHAIEVMDAHEPEALLDEQAVQH